VRSSSASPPKPSDHDTPRPQRWRRLSNLQRNANVDRLLKFNPWLTPRHPEPMSPVQLQVRFDSLAAQRRHQADELVTALRHNQPERVGALLREMDHCGAVAVILAGLILDEQARAEAYLHTIVSWPTGEATTRREPDTHQHGNDFWNPLGEPHD
jgi:hypothetical protein